MIFNSYMFIFLFLPLSLLGYFTLNRLRNSNIAKIYLIGMSFWFYGYFNPRYIWIMIFSISVNYIIGNALLNQSNKKRLILVVGLFLNVGILFYFKYYDFFITNLNTIFSTDFTLRNILLPLGISFFTFQQISYIVDCYRGTVLRYNILDYSLFVTFFPQLVAGPIVLHSEIVPQFENENNKKINFDNVAKGLYLLSSGLGKKVLIADTLALYVNYGFSNISSLKSLDAIFIMIAYTLQIYFDFSGYCDIATGIAYMFNIKLPSNFNSPYKATSILDFWDRWHMTLTRFFTTYIYIPLGGSRKGIKRTLINVFIVFLVSGIWHGASWTFVIWGSLHGLFSIITRVFQRFFAPIPKFVGWITTFLFVNFTWVIFRAENLAQANKIFLKMIEFSDISFGEKLFSVTGEIVEFNILASLIGKYVDINWNIALPLVMIFICIVGVMFYKNTIEKTKHLKLNCINMITTSIVLTWCILSFAGVSTFLYFNF